MYTHISQSWMWVDILVVMEKDTIRANYYEFEMLYIRCCCFFVAVNLMNWYRNKF